MFCDKNLLNYDLACMALRHLTVTRVTWFLTYIFDCGGHEIYSASGVSTTPISLATEPFLAGSLAERVEIWFWGGPHEAEDWYCGSLLTLLVDKLFYCVAMDYEDVVAKFLEALNGCHTGSHNKTRQVESTPTICA